MPSTSGKVARITGTAPRRPTQETISVSRAPKRVSASTTLVASGRATIVVLALTRLGARDTLMVSWVGLRGAVPVILATFPLVEGIPQAELIFNVVFFIVITSVLVQGTTSAPRVC